MGRPLDEPITIHPVRNHVNNPKTDDPHRIERVRIDRNLFEKSWWSD